MSHWTSGSYDFLEHSLHRRLADIFSSDLPGIPQGTPGGFLLEFVMIFRSTPCIVVRQVISHRTSQGLPREAVGGSIEICSDFSEYPLHRGQADNFSSNLLGIPYGTLRSSYSNFVIIFRSTLCSIVGRIISYRTCQLFPGNPWVGCFITNTGLRVIHC